MAQLKFPEIDAPPRSGFRNLNGDGGRTELWISLPILVVITAISWGSSWVSRDTDPGFNWIGCLLVVALAWYSMRLFNVTIVEHSEDALRIQRRGRKHVIPYSDVLSVRESGRFAGGGAVLGTTHARYVTVTLKRAYPFGRSFYFYTKNEYGDFDGLSGPAKLIQSYAASAQLQEDRRDAAAEDGS
ncbi:hypothetical protein [Haloferula rosea]|uniref:PH domain-containing protein n=1 Tax=Haloferula rosea TaxID=490093 RepID=A0A934RCT5_9BACT|nr:hypothetical protein [Haloferula rosea]MBK1826676.1 hypothetical protein [Haloferula rosea]